MKQLKFLSVLVLATLFSLSVSAQERPEGFPDGFPEQANHHYVSPDTVAKHQTNELSVELGLTEKQYKKVYKLLLKQEKQRRENMYADRVPNRDMVPSGMDNGKKPGKGPGGPGLGTPPGGMGRPAPGMNGKGPMGPPPNSDVNKDMAKKQEKENKKFLKDMKKVLTESQYDKWLDLSSKRPPLHGQPHDKSMKDKR